MILSERPELDGRVCAGRLGSVGSGWEVITRIRVLGMIHPRPVETGRGFPP